MRLLLLLLAAALAMPQTVWAGEADVVGVRVEKRDDGYAFFVTVQHADEGWEHYADRWDILTPGGKVLATRVLRHPHVDEQPFTRSLKPVSVPDSVSRVEVRAHDTVHGTGGKTVAIELPR